MTTRTRSGPTGAVRVGCSGWNYGSWRPALYPAGMPAREWLAHYAQRFDTVEVNATFYRLVSPETTARWVAQTPAHFTFAVKASRYLTHIRRLRDIGKGVARFMAGIEPLRRAGRLGPLLWQLPENFHRDDRRLADALEQLPRGLRHAFEFRHETWFAPEVYELLAHRGIALVLADGPGRHCDADGPDVGWRYVRLHHGHRGRRGNYSRSELEEWAQRLAAWSAHEDVYAYFNNDWEAFAPRNAWTLSTLLADDGLPHRTPAHASRAGRRAVRSRPEGAARS